MLVSVPTSECSDFVAREDIEPCVPRQETFLRRLAEALPVHIAYIDRDSRYRFVNRLQCERFGLPPDAILGRTRAEMPCGVGNPPLERHVELVFAGQPQVFECEEIVDGTRRIFECRLVPDMDDSGRVRGFFSAAFDITEREHAARSLERESATLHSITEAVPAAIMVVDRQMRCRFVNEAFERWRGVPRGQVIDCPMEEVLGDSDYLRIRPWAHRALAGETVQFERDYGGRGPATHLSFTCIPLRLHDGRIDGFVGVARDVTADRLEQARLMHLASCDPLTGLLNRAGFDERMREMVGSRHAAPVALLCIDLDRFKPVNDLHGHPVGDQLLRLVADRLLHLVRPADAVARVGGDEFAILLGGMRERTHALAVADKVVQAAGMPFELGSVIVEIGASVGVAWGHGDPAELNARADTALYEAKRAGRGVVRCAPDPMTGGRSPFASG